jgi:hypothetical protein
MSHEFGSVVVKLIFNFSREGSVLPGSSGRGNSLFVAVPQYMHNLIRINARHPPQTKIDVRAT